MARARQFSLSYLLLEIFWIAIALAATRASFVAGAEDLRRRETFAILIPFAVWFWLIAIGGACGRMTLGAALGFIAFWLLILLLPAFIY